MNAVAVDVGADAERAERRLDGRERSRLEYELEAWGKWWEERAEFTGHASASAITAFLEGFGGGAWGDRILCQEMPNGVYWTHQRWLRLPDDQREVVWNHYVAAVDPNTGRCPTPEQKAALLGISWGNYRVRLCRARFAIMGLKAPL
jgi:hypothetical protein